MKRNIAIAAVTAAVLIGGGAVTTAAFAGDDSSRAAGATSGAQAADSPRTGDRIDVDDAVAAALKAVPGTVTEAELDDDDRDVWELDVYGPDKVWHDVTVDAHSGTVLTDREDDDNDDRDRRAARSAAVSLGAAVDAARTSVPGTVTSVDLDDDDDDDRGSGTPHWDVDITGKDGTGHELRVDAKTGKVTADRGDRDDDRGDDRDDD